VFRPAEGRRDHQRRRTHKPPASLPPSGGARAQRGLTIGRVLQGVVMQPGVFGRMAGGTTTPGLQVAGGGPARRGVGV
jgi:hypothetical protein